MSEAVQNQDSDVIESPPQAKTKLDKGFARNLKIIGGAIAVLVFLVLLVVLLKSGSGSEAPRESEIQAGGSGARTDGTLTPAMEKMLTDQQKIEATTAASKGETYIPPDPTGKVVAIEAPTPSTYQAAALPQATVNNERDQRRREGLDRQLAAYLGEVSSDGVVRQRVQGEEEPEAKEGTASAANSAATASASGKQIVPGFEIAAARLSNDITVPAGSSVFASAVIEAGPLKGGFLIGTAKVIDEALEIQFTQMRLGTTVYPVDAIVLDQDTAANAIAGNVDRRILQRYVMPVALAAAQGFFTAKAQVGSVAVSVGNSAGVATGTATTEQARAAGIAEAGKLASTVVAAEAAKPIVVSAPRGISVGLLFRAPVKESSQ